MMRDDASPPPTAPSRPTSRKGQGTPKAAGMVTPSKQRRGPPPAISTDVNDQRPPESFHRPSPSVPASAEANHKSGGGGAEFRQAQTPKHCNKTGGEKVKKSSGSGKKKDKQKHGKEKDKSPRSAPNLSGGGPPPLHGNQGGPTHLQHEFIGYQQGGPGVPGSYYTQQRYPPQFGNGPPPHYGPGGPPPPHQMHSPRSRGQAGAPPHTPPHPSTTNTGSGQMQGEDGPGGSRQQPYMWSGSIPGGPPPNTVSPGSSSFRGGLPASASWEHGNPHFYGGYHPQQHFQQHGGPPMPPFQGRQPPQAGGGNRLQQQEDAGRFTRAVSSSFENVKSKGSNDDSKDGKPVSFSHDLDTYANQHGRHHRTNSKDGGAPDDASAGAASDHSWGALHQVKSVDEAQLRAAELANAKSRGKRDAAHTPTDQVQGDHLMTHPSSNTSSLSHSPGHPTHASNNKITVYPPPPTPSKLTSLDSLSSVASIQEPIDTSGRKDAKKGTSADDASWGHGAPDLMQCGTGSSGSLLFPTHHLRGHSLDHIGGKDPVGGKRAREERGDGETYNASRETDEIRKAPSGSPENGKSDGGEGTKKATASSRPAKKGRTRSVTEDTAGKDGGDKSKTKQRQEQQKYKASPLSISCSPPGSPHAGMIQIPVMQEQKAVGGGAHQPKATYPNGGADAGKNKDATGDKGHKPTHSYMASPGIPNYTFSIDSMPSFSKDGTARMMPYPQGLPPRPGSASSGSVQMNQRMTGGPAGQNGAPSGPGHADKGGNIGQHQGGIPQSMPSWEIHGQDSFAGGMSVGSGGSGGGGVGGPGGHGLFSSFSFTNDYNMLAQSGSNLGHPGAGGGNGPAPPQQDGSSQAQDQGRGPTPPQQQQEKGGAQSGSKPQTEIESRNQSFDQSNQYRQGGVTRSDTFDTAYSMTSGPPRPGGGYQQQPGGMLSPEGRQYPPHAHSWTSTGSGPGAHGSQQYHFVPPGGPPGQFRGGGQQGGGMYSPPPHHQHLGPHGMPMSRTFTEDSVRSSSPSYGGMMQNGAPPMVPGQDPHGPPGRHPGDLAGIPNAFRPPPPEFGAPQSNIGKRPPPTVYIMASNPGGSGGGGTRGPMGGSRPAPPSQQFHDPSLMSKSGSSTGAGSREGVFSWTKEDDSRLTEIMKKYKNPKDWEPISREHGRGKGAKECHERWIRYLKPGVRKGQWTDHEDAIVVEAVTTSTEQPFTRWSDLAQRLPGRVGKQIRDRWVNHLNPSINHMPFSREDDLNLWNGHKELGKRWVEISTKFFNSSRSENHIKNRWYSASFKKFVSHEFGPNAYTGGKKKEKDNKGKASKGKGIKAE